MRNKRARNKSPFKSIIAAALTLCLLTALTVGLLILSKPAGLASPNQSDLTGTITSASATSAASASFTTAAGIAAGTSSSTSEGTAKVNSTKGTSGKTAAASTTSSTNANTSSTAHATTSSTAFATTSRTTSSATAEATAETTAETTTVHAPAADPTMIPFNLLLTWTGDTSTTQTISWKTTEMPSKSIVQFYATTDKSSAADTSAGTLSSLASSVTGSSKLFNTGTSDLYINTVTLSGLKPDTRYIYRAGDGTNWSEVSSFTTGLANSGAFKFIVFGDSQCEVSGQAYSPWGKTVQNAFNANQDARFFVNVGDLVDTGQNYTHWKDWFTAAKGVLEHISAMPAEGNHEDYPLASPTKPFFWIDQFDLPQNGPAGLKTQVYSYDFGDAHITVLDSQLEEGSGTLNAQKTWLDNDLKSTTKKWKIVFFHKPYYYVKNNRDNDPVKVAFQPIIDKYHVDVVFNGHDHGVARTFPINADNIVSKPSQGTVYYITGRSGDKTYSDLTKSKWDAFFYKPLDQPDYLTVSINGNVMRIKVFKQDGSVLDDYSIDKAADADSE